VGLRSAVLGAGLERRLRRRTAGLPSGPDGTAPVTDADLAALPGPAQRYLRFTGAVGRPRDRSLRARWTGSFRLRPGAGWAPFVAQQYNTAPVPGRVYAMRLTLAGVLPMDGVDTYLDGAGRMRGTLLGLVRVADGSGPEFDTSELVTWLNDAVLLAHTMLLEPAVTWTAVDDTAFDVALTDAGRTVTARVTVDDRGRVQDFGTEDRYAALPGGPTRARWTTPVDGWTTSGERPLPDGGRALWHLPEGPYEYGRARVDPRAVAWNSAP
jgi:hypothetical protein